MKNKEECNNSKTSKPHSIELRRKRKEEIGGEFTKSEEET